MLHLAKVYFPSGATARLARGCSGLDDRAYLGSHLMRVEARRAAWPATC